MQKKHIVRLTDAERLALEQNVRKYKGSLQKVRTEATAWWQRTNLD
jgi:hypothetical protein